MFKSKVEKSALLIIMLVLISLCGCGGSGGSEGQQPDGDEDSSADGDHDSDIYFPPDGDEESLPDGDDWDADDDIDSTDGDSFDSEDDGQSDGDEAEFDDEAEFEQPDEDSSDTAEEDIADTSEDDHDDIDTAESDHDNQTDGDTSEKEPDAEYQCAADEYIDYGDLPLLVTRSTIENDSRYDGHQCFYYNFNGGDYVFGVELLKLEILEITVAPLEGNDFGLYVLDACEEDEALCVEGTDSSSAGQNEHLSFRAQHDGLYYIVIDGKQAGSGGQFEIMVRLGQDNGVAPTGHCDSHIDCDADGGAGFCIVKERWDASFCTLECESAEDCDGFESGCCMPVAELGGKFCYLAKYCGVAGMTAMPGEACATATHTNKPLCNPTAGAEYCEDEKNTPYCSHTCSDDDDCSDLTGGCCVKTSPSASSGSCVYGGDCPHACTPDVNVEHNSLPLTITNKSTSSYDNRVSAYGCKFNGTPGREVVFGVALNAGETLQATLSKAQSFDGVLYVAGGCGWTLAECRAFADENGFGGNETLRYTAASSGIYYVVVDSTSFAQSGSFRLNLQLVDIGSDGDLEAIEYEDVEDVDGDSMGDCNPLAVFSNEQLYDYVTVSGNTSSAINDFQVSGCGGAQQFGRDDYYAVEVMAGDKLNILLDNTGDWDASIAVYRDCIEGGCAKLVDSGLSSQDEYLTWTSNVNGMVYVVVDSPSPSSNGSYQLTMSFNDISADGDADSDSGESYSCQAGDYTNIGTFADLASGGFTETSSTIGLTNKSELSTGVANCLGSPTPGPDRIYSIYLQYQQEIRVTLSDVGNDFDPLLYLSSVCGKPIVCRTGSDEGGINEGEQITFKAPANGTYYIIVDGPRSESDPSGGWYASGTYTITVTQNSGK